MNVALITNTTNGVGLERDVRLLSGILERAGHVATPVHFQGQRPNRKFDLAIFLEIYDGKFKDVAPVSWLIPNPEWWFVAQNHVIPTFAKILCKTYDALRLFEPLGGRCVFTGFVADDRLDVSVPRQKRFLHIAGDSMLKGSGAVVEAWQKYNLPYPLTILSRRFVVPKRLPNTTVKKRVSEDEVRRLQNECLFNLAPSGYEGFGHVLHEAMSVGAVLVTTDAPPMNELKGIAYRIPGVSSAPHELARVAVVSAEGVRDAVEAVWRMPDEQIAELRARARKAFEDENSTFGARFRELLVAFESGRDVQEPVRVVEKRSPPRPYVPTLAPFDPERGPRIAVVLPVHRSRADIVLRTVMSLRGQTLKSDFFEVVLAVDGGDRDGVFESIAAHARSADVEGQAIDCTVVESPRPRGDHPHRNHARNAGWRAARSPLCWILDCDFMLPPHALEHILLQHDAALALGRPAILSPCMGGIGGASPEEWLAISKQWVESGNPLDMQIALSRCQVGTPIYSGYPEKYTGPREPKSVELPSPLEGMPILWRGLLEALGGFSEDFGEWGGDKEELVDRLRGIVRAGLAKFRLLTSVMALHQPHHSDPEAWSPAARLRMNERERRHRLIETKTHWWKEQLARVQAAFPAALAAAGPHRQFEVTPLSDAEETNDSEEGWSAKICSAIVRYLVPRMARPTTKGLVVGASDSQIAELLRQKGIVCQEATLDELPSLPFKSFQVVVGLDILSSLDATERERIARITRQLLQVSNFGVFVERVRSPKDGPGLPTSTELQRVFRGLVPSGTFNSRGSAFTVFGGRLLA